MLITMLTPVGSLLQREKVLPDYIDFYPLWDDPTSVSSLSIYIRVKRFWMTLSVISSDCTYTKTVKIKFDTGEVFFFQ